MRRNSRRDAALEARKLLETPNAVIVDTETTDLRGYLVQIAVIDMTGAVLLDTLVNPQAPISLGAQRIHGLTVGALADAPTFAQIADQVMTLLHGRTVVVYNAAFDREILTNEVWRLTAARNGIAGERPMAAWPDAQRWISGCTWACAMEVWSQFVGEWNPRYGNFRWQPLPGGDHSAAGDAAATLSVIQRMAADAPTEDTDVHDPL